VVTPFDDDDGPADADLLRCTCAPEVDPYSPLGCPICGEQS
jgi:hypothetical protein